MKGTGAWVVIATMFAQAKARVDRLNLYTYSSNRGYDDIPGKHKKHKRGRPKKK